MNVGNRLKKIRKAKGLTQQALGEFINVSKQAVANVESGHSNPSLEFISKLIENLNINSNWLITGKGEMFNPPKFEDVEDSLTSKVEEILKKKGLI